MHKNARKTPNFASIFGSFLDPGFPAFSGCPAASFSPLFLAYFLTFFWVFWPTVKIAQNCIFGVRKCAKNARKMHVFLIFFLKKNFYDENFLTILKSS